MVHGSCLCGGVRFEIHKIAGPFELCHCTRCRKLSGSAFFAGVYVNREDFRLMRGKELIKTYEAPILNSPPPYRACYCSQCGSPVPDSLRESEKLEIPAGLLDDDPGFRPDKHIFVEVKSKWFEIADDLPQFTGTELRRIRSKEPE